MMDKLETISVALSVLLGVIALISAVGAPIMKLNKNLVHLNDLLVGVRKDQDEGKICNEREHRELRIKDSELEKAVNTHTTEIAVIKKVLEKDEKP